MAHPRKVGGKRVSISQHTDKTVDQAEQAADQSIAHITQTAYPPPELSERPASFAYPIITSTAALGTSVDEPNCWNGPLELRGQDLEFDGWYRNSSVKGQ